MTDPVQKFLGERATMGGPFGLLGVAVSDELDDRAVVEAADRALELVNAHPQGSTPEADEVRLAIHAAAAQLLDPQVRRHIVRRWAGEALPPLAPTPPTAPPQRASPTPPASRPAPARATQPRRDETDYLIEHDAILVLGLYGGWNKRSLQRLTWLAHARGIPSERIARTLQTFSQRPRGAARTASALPRTTPTQRAPTPPRPHSGVSTPAAPATSSDTLPPERRSSPVLPVMIGGSVILSMVAVLVAVLISINLSTAPSDAPETSGGELASSVPPPSLEELFPTAPKDEPEQEPAKPKQYDPRDVVRDLRACVSGIEVDPQQAVADFERVVSVLSRNWMSVPDADRRAAHDTILEMVYRVNDSSLRRVVVAAVSIPSIGLAGDGAPNAKEVAPSVWSVGMLTRLSRERDLPAGARSDVESALRAALNDSIPTGDRLFSDGALAAISEIPGRLATADEPDANAWGRWIACVDAVSGSDGALRAELILLALDTILRIGPPPETTPWAFDAIGLLVTSLSWREDEGSREWLVRLFDSSGVTSADLNAVTMAVASRSSAPGVDALMVLPRGSTELARVELRDRYATVWGLRNADARDELADDWLDVARKGVRDEPESRAASEQLDACVTLARINGAAALRWRGSLDEAADLIDELKRPPIDSQRHARAKSNGDPFASTSSGVEWAVKYLDARRNIPVRMEMLSRLADMRGRLGAFEAEVLVAEAVRGSPIQVRMEAQQRVRQYAQSPAVVSAMLDELSTMPRTLANASLASMVGLGSTPSIDDPDWRSQIRAMLVTRLLELLAGQGDFAAVDDGAFALGEAYALRVAMPRRSGSDETAPDLSASVTGTRVRWQRLAETIVGAPELGLTLEQIVRRRGARSGLAEGPIQAFAVEQLGVCELMAFVIAGEQPHRAPDVRLVLDTMAEERRDADQIFEQLTAVERAMVRLWSVRFGEPMP